MNLYMHPFDLFIVVFLFFGLVTAIVNYFSVRRFDQYRRADEFPRVSILVPARNEAHNIKACVDSLLSQDYPDFEVIVLDDQSTDETSAILAEYKKVDSRMQVLEGAPLPEGWLGKPWACHQLYQAASGDLILFTDADTRHAPNTLRDSISALIAEGADLVTAFPKEEVVSLGERLLVPIMGWGIFTFVPLRLAQKMRIPSLCITIGQFMLFRRKAYEAIGGYEGIRCEIVDDISLGRKIMSSGLEWRLMDGTHHVNCRMYRNFWEAVGGFSKSLFAVFDYRILPFFAGWAIVGTAFLMPVVALVSRWARHPLTAMPLDYAAGSVVISILLYMIAYRRFRFPAYLVFYYPVSLALFIAVAIRSFFQTARGTSTWKDRPLERVEMRWL
jgi:chlorobactene glucosyltransferase